MVVCARGPLKGLRSVFDSRSDEGPALHDLDYEVFARRQRLVAISGAALRAPQIQVTVQPQTELAAVYDNTYILRILDKKHTHLFHA